MEEQIDINNLLYESSKCNYDFKNIATTRSFSEDIYDGKITISEGNKKQSAFFWILIVNWKLTANDFKIGIFQLKSVQDKELKILTLKEMIHRLPVALAQVH